MEPVAGRETEPVSRRETEPVAGREMEPVNGRETEPVAGRETEPVSGREMEPVNGRETEPVAGRETEPVAGRETEPVAGRGTEPVSGRETEPVSGRETEPVSGRETEPVSGRETEPVSGRELEPITEWIRQRFHTVENVCSDAVEQLVKENREGVLLVDARSPAEYEVSHLEGAVRIDPDNTNMDHVVKQLGLADCSKDKTVVCYCTAGYHGSEMAQNLSNFLTRDPGQKQDGSLKVYNLEGGLVKWANERKPIVDGTNQPTSLVHPYNAVWGQLLEPRLRAPI
ncbi:uncharacterized protein [Heptranchias perlo]|uniref:uncharacterized protein n=1 Tax=Heptranchias perlo TaxID=212740 RepID=UPI003559FCA0